MKSISALVIGKQWDIVIQRLLHQSFNNMLSKRGEKRKQSLGNLEGRPPQTSSPRRRRKSVDTYPLATPFDCVAIAPCCFAERKAVLSHALATLTALTRARAKPQRELLAALTRCNVRESAEEFEQRIFFHSEDRPHTRR